MTPLTILSTLKSSKWLWIVIVLVILFFGARAWHNGRVKASYEKGRLDLAAELMNQKPEIKKDTVWLSPQSVSGRASAHIPKRSGTPNLDSLRAAVSDSILDLALVRAEAESQFSTSASDTKGNAVSISGTLGQSYDPILREFGYDLRFNPIPITSTTETKYVPSDCPTPSWFDLRAELEIGGLLQDKILNLNNKAYSFTVVPTFASQRRFEVSVPIGVVMMPDGIGGFETGLGASVRLSIRLAGE